MAELSLIICLVARMMMELSLVAMTTFDQPLSKLSAPSPAHLADPDKIFLISCRFTEDLTILIGRQFTQARRSLKRGSGWNGRGKGYIVKYISDHSPQVTK